MTKTYQHYQVAADRNTGEWLGEPEHVGTVEINEWREKQDTDTTHFDTYEHPGGTIGTETRAIEVMYA